RYTLLSSCFFFVFRRTPTSPLFLHDALPISHASHEIAPDPRWPDVAAQRAHRREPARDRRHHLSSAYLQFVKRLARRRHHRHLQDRKSTRLNSSHLGISYAVFCLKKKKQHGQ